MIDMDGFLFTLQLIALMQWMGIEPKTMVMVLLDLSLGSFSHLNAIHVENTIF